MYTHIHHTHTTPHTPHIPHTYYTHTHTLHHTHTLRGILQVLDGFQQDQHENVFTYLLTPATKLFHIYYSKVFKYFMFTFQEFTWTQQRRILLQLQTLDTGSQCRWVVGAGEVAKAINCECMHKQQQQQNKQTTTVTTSRCIVKKTHSFKGNWSGKKK